MEVRLRIGKNVVGKHPKETRGNTVGSMWRISEVRSPSPLPPFPRQISLVFFFSTYLTLKFLQRQNRTLLLNMKYLLFYLS